MRRLVTLPLFLISIICSATTYYVSPSGNNSNNGISLTTPWKDLNYAAGKLSAGDILYMRGGTYLTQNNASATWHIWIDGKAGTATNPIRIEPYQNEVPVFDLSNITTPTYSGNCTVLIVQNCSYLTIKGLRITNAKQNTSGAPMAGMSAYNCSNCTFEQLTVDHIGGYGIKTEPGNTNILYKNCDVHHCVDYYPNPGNNQIYENANGFNVTGADGTEYALNTSTNITYDGCRVWNCSDDGFDFFGAIGVITIKNTWSFWNGFENGTSVSLGNGQGFKMGPSVTAYPTSLRRIVTNCLAVQNKANGFDINTSSSYQNILQNFFNNTAYDNGGLGYAYGTTSANGIADVFKNNLSYSNNGWAETQFHAGVIQDHNSWNGGVTVSDADFVSIGTDVSVLTSPRKADGSLPDIALLHFVSGSDLIDAGVNVGLPYGGNAPDMGAFETQLTSNPESPVYVSSAVENSTPSVLAMTYNLTLANIVPAASSFTVNVNSAARTVSSVAISGTKVLLTLATPVVYGDVVTVAYTKPANNPIQTAAGGQAATISAQVVTNNVSAVVLPVYVSSAIQNATPNSLEMTYNLTLANIVPAASCFTVNVNSAARTVSSVAISGTKVLLTLATPVVYGDVVTVAYTKPATNPIQTAAGGQAATISAQAVTNNVSAVVLPVYVSSAIQNATPNSLEMTYNLTLANIVPAASSFTVNVNSAARTVSSVAISGTKVLLTLATPVVYGDVVTVAYTKPATNPIQTVAGGQAATIGAQAVTNNVGAVALPVYVSSAIQNATPNSLEMTYNINLTNIVPATSAFTVVVNSAGRSVSAVAVSGTKVQLTLTSRIFPGDIVTVSYTKPSSNPIQTSSGGVAASISNQPVTNNCINVAPTVIISSPVTGSAFTSPASITISADASDADGTVSQVEFYNGSTKLGTSLTAPYTFTWNNVAAGTYSLTAIATDKLNAKTTSSAISVTVNNSRPNQNKRPFVKISNPRKGVSYGNISSIEINAVASDDDGTITKVEFYNGTTKLVELTSSPYTYTWKDVVRGNYTITAIATDNSNDTTISSPVEFVVGNNVKYDANSDIIKLYPNPNNGHFSIEFINPMENEKSEIVITDQTGKQVYSGPVLREEIVKQIDLPEGRAGIYVMMIKDKDIYVTKKFIKNNQ
jgi:uncharacterized repeat protein (TIGR02059 family)